MNFMKNNPLPRLEKDEELKQKLLPFCRLNPGDIWIDSISNHKVGCLDAANLSDIQKLMSGNLAKLAVHDPPYNLVAFRERELSEYIQWCKKWVSNTWQVLDEDSAFYVWLGADQKNHFQPFPDFMIIMRETGFEPKSFITMRNQNETELFKPIIEEILSLSSTGTSNKFAVRVIADHIRAAVFILAGGIIPGNVDQPYVARRLIRRAVFATFSGYFVNRRYGRELGIRSDFLSKLAETTIPTLTNKGGNGECRRIVVIVLAG